MIVVEDLHKSFNGVEVLRGVSFHVERGEVLALVGPSGDGKSVLLKHLVGLLRPDRGRVLIDGKDVNALSTRELQRLRERCAYLFQSGALFNNMTVFDNVAFPLREKTRLRRHEVRTRVLHELERVGLRGSEQKYPSQLSGGMLKRAALARALVGSPEIMLFDEPTTGLDPVIVRSINSLIETVHRQFNFTGIIVSHDVPSVLEIVQKVALLHQGVIQIFGPPSAVRASLDPIVQNYVPCQPQMRGPRPAMVENRPDQEV